MADVKEAQVEPMPEVPAAVATEMEDVKEAEAEAVKEAQVESTTPEVPAAAEMEEVPSAAEPPVAASAPAAAKSQKRKRATAVAGSSLEDVAAAIKRCNEAADKAEAGIRELQATADAERAKARKLSQDYERKKRDEALAHLDSLCRKKPSNPFFLFAEEYRPTMGVVAGKGGATKKIAEAWANLSDAEKQKYVDKTEAAKQEYAAWATSEEGAKILQERGEILRQCKASKSELAEASAAPEPQQAAQAEEATTPGRLEQAFAVAAEAKTTPEKPEKQRQSRAAPAPEPVLDEKVLEAASKADLVVQLRNLAGRPEVAALKKSPQELLDALTANGGLVNAAKRALLGA